VIHEQNAVAGLTNRWLARVATRVAEAFPGSFGGRRRVSCVGNPIRPAIAALAPPRERFVNRSGPLRRLVFGGSQGASALNRLLQAALARLPQSRRPRVLHQSGEHERMSTALAYHAAGVEAEVLPFIDDMAARLSQCDVVVCRAGAVTVSELCAAGVPAILVPLIVSTTAHQRDNAEYMARHDAAVHQPQAQLTPHGLAAQLAGLERGALQRMAANARALARPHAAARVADQIERLVRKERRT
jgi:UDP-N-acetylglucosamine--N-acetylmuramyl-(pentapeptide) pyrophosphoryl-undecaprenol N-acetylglucosamine transferase